MIDLCKIFGVEEGEEFKLEGSILTKGLNYKIQDNNLKVVKGRYEEDSLLEVNEVAGIEVIKLPKKKEFTDDELAIMRSIEINYKWIVRNRNGRLFLHKDKPEKYINGAWDSRSWCGMQVFNHLFQSIKWEDEEPVFIDDYVERGVE